MLCRAKKFFAVGKEHRRFFLFDNANEVQGERRAKLVCAMLSRSLHSLLQLVCESKIKHKKKVYEETSYTSKGIPKGSKGIPKP